MHVDTPSPAGQSRYPSGWHTEGLREELNLVDPETNALYRRARAFEEQWALVREPPAKILAEYNRLIISLIPPAPSQEDPK